MEYLLSFIAKWFSDPQQAGWVFAGTIGVAATLFVLGVLAVVLGVFDPVRRRVHAIAPAAGGAAGGRGEAFAKMVRPIEHYVLPQNLEEQSKVRMQLVHAGFRSPSALTTFYALKLLLSLGLAAAAILLAPMFPTLTTFQVMFIALSAAGLGLIAPSIVLARLVEKRQRAILNGFPDTLDLLVTCTEAGLALNSALQRVAQEITISYPALAEELTLVNSAIRAGVDRVEALRGLADRTGLSDIRGLVSILALSLRLGTSVADTLRVYSEEMRDKRMQRAEEMAAKIGTKLIFPLVFCMWPAFFVVAIGPAIIGVIRVFQQ